MAAVTGTGLNRVLTLGPSFFQLPQFRTMLLEEDQVGDVLTGVHNPNVNMNNLLARYTNQGLLIFHELLHIVGEAPLDRAPRTDEFGVTRVIDARMDNDAELERSQGDIYKPMEAIAAVQQYGPARAIRNAANYEWLGLRKYFFSFFFSIFFSLSQKRKKTVKLMYAPPLSHGMQWPTSHSEIGTNHYTDRPRSKKKPKTPNCKLPIIPSLCLLQRKREEKLCQSTSHTRAAAAAALKVGATQVFFFGFFGYRS